MAEPRCLPILFRGDMVRDAITIDEVCTALGLDTGQGVTQ